jgi:hypothetical protein
MVGVHDVRTSERPRMGTAASAASCVVVNALLGLLGYAPVLATQILVSAWVGEHGWWQPTQYFRDGAGVVWGTCLLLWAVFVPLAYLANRWLRRRSSLSRPLHLVLCTSLLVLPSVVEVWRSGWLLV